MQKTPVLTDRSLSAKDERINSSTRGATLIHGMTRALSGIPSYSRQLTYAPRRRILGFPVPRLTHPRAAPFLLSPLAAPSAAHLTICISIRLPPDPDSLYAHNCRYSRFIGLTVYHVKFSINYHNSYLLSRKILSFFLTGSPSTRPLRSCNSALLRNTAA